MAHRKVKLLHILFLGGVVLYTTNPVAVLAFPTTRNFHQRKLQETRQSSSFSHCRPAVVITKLYVASTIASIAAGSIAGAVGVGVAFPFDTLKTKAQVLTFSTSQSYEDHNSSTNDDDTIISESIIESAQQQTAKSPGMFEIIKLVYQREGVQGFFGGVKVMMAGQAIIKAVAFATNETTVSFLKSSTHLDPTFQLILGAAIAGFVTSFFVTPIERIKVLMQAQDSSSSSPSSSANKTFYKNELECFRSIFKNEGLIGILSRGLVPTLWREVPSYAIYFVVYGLLMQSSVIQFVDNFVPGALVSGALAGCACWIPVYPVDVVKTVIQNSSGMDDDEPSMIEVAKDLYKNGGIGVFFDGLTPKMIRASVNHSVTFYLYDLLMKRVII